MTIEIGLGVGDNAPCNDMKQESEALRPPGANSDSQKPLEFQPSKFVSPLRLHGQQDALRLNQHGLEFFNRATSEPNRKVLVECNLSDRTQEDLVQIADDVYFNHADSLTQYQAATDLLPKFDDHVSRLQNLVDLLAMRCRRVVPKWLPSFRFEFFRSPAGIAILLIICGLLNLSWVTVDAEFESAVAIVIDGPMFETPNPNPALPSIEPSRELAISVVMAPVLGLLLVLEFISQVFRRNKTPIFALLLGGIGIPLMLGTTLGFAFFVSGASFQDPTVASAFQTPTLPWYYPALSMTALAVANAIIFFLVIRLAKLFFQRAPSEVRWDAKLVSELNHAVQCISDTLPSRSAIAACVKKHDNARAVFRESVLAEADRQRKEHKRRELRRRLDDLDD